MRRVPASAGNLTEAVANVAETDSGKETVPDLAGHADHLIEVAGRAPSVHNTQPWRFEVSKDAIVLYADPSRQLLEDSAGREMLISCGAALYGLRLGIRSLGFRPVVELFPEHAGWRLARVRAGRPSPTTSRERKLLQAVPHRHTHRGPFEPRPLPVGLVAQLRHDAAAECATLSVIKAEAEYQRLTAILGAWSRVRDLYPASRAEVRSRDETLRWTREAGSQARDGVPAHAFPPAAGSAAGSTAGSAAERLPERDFDLGRGWGLLPSGGPPAPVTALLVTAGDNREDWLRAGQALQRLLLHAASKWVFARLQTQPLQDSLVQAQLSNSLTLPGSPQVLLQLGAAWATHPTARRPAAEVIGP